MVHGFIEQFRLDINPIMCGNTNVGDNNVVFVTLYSHHRKSLYYVVLKITLIIK